MKQRTHRPLLALLPLTLCLWATQAQAGRPLAVDDANVNEKGAGQVEIWMDRGSDNTNTWNVAPAFAPVEGVEVGVSYAKPSKNGNAQQAIQAKWRITPSQDNGCNFASTLGVAHEQTVGSSPYVVGIVTCNTDGTSVHLNLTHQSPKGEPNFSSWGMALERPMGRVTPHVELFGDEGGQPTLQFGVKTEIAPGLQLDGSVGRDQQNKANVFSLGFKVSF